MLENQLIGEGEYSKTYICGDRVIKTLKPEYDVSEYEREAAILSTLDHPLINRMLEFNKDARQIVLESCGNIDFESYINLFKPGTDASQQVRQNYFENVLKVLYNSAIGLQHMHERGVVHRDVKPQNIRITCDPDVEGLILYSELIDLGSAVSLNEDGEETPRSEIFYKAPEVDDGVKDPKNDLYSLGVTFLHALRGEKVFDDIPWEEIEDYDCRNYQQEHLRYQTMKAKEEYPEFAEVIDHIVGRTLGYDYNKRASIVEFIELIRDVVFDISATYQHQPSHSIH